MKIESTLSEPLLSSDSEKEETSVPVQTGLRKGTFVKEAGLVVGFTTKTFLLISI